jgi:hypothetical protein
MNDSMRYPQSDRKWLPYAVLTLSSEALARDVLESWLSDRLHLLALPEEFSCRVLASASDSVACIPAGIYQIRLLIFTTGLTPSHGQARGFFRTVKNGGIPEDPAVYIQEIAFFLYVEGGFLKDGSIQD